MTTLTRFLTNAITHFAGCHVLSSAPDEKSMQPYAYYLIKRQDKWQLRFLRNGELVKVPETEFGRYRGLEKLKAALDALPASALMVESKEDTSAVTNMLRNFHATSRVEIANKVKEALVNRDHGFLSRIFSDLPQPYLSGKELSGQVETYQKLMGKMVAEYKAMQLDDDAFMARDKHDKAGRKYQQAEIAVADWIQAVVTRGQQELFTKYGSVKHEITYVLTSVLPADASVKQVVPEFEQSTVKQGLLRAYVALVMQEITRALPENFMREMPNVLWLEVSRLIKANTLYQPDLNVGAALSQLMPGREDEAKPDAKMIAGSKKILFDFMFILSTQLQQVCSLLEGGMRDKLKAAKQDEKNFHFTDDDLAVLQKQNLVTTYEVDCYKTCRDLVYSLGRMQYAQNTQFDYAPLMAEFLTCYQQLIDLPSVPEQRRSIFKSAASPVGTSRVDAAIQVILQDFAESGLVHFLEANRRARSPDPKAKK